MSITDSLEFLSTIEDITDKEQEVFLPIHSLTPDPDQPRKFTSDDLDDEELEGLALNIQHNGIINPITVQKSDESKFLIISGERRWRAAKIAGFKEVPCRILSGDQLDKVKVIQLSENIQRQDMTLLQTAQALEDCLKKYHVKQKELAKLLGKSEQYISAHLLLLKAEGEVYKAIEDGVINSPHTYRVFKQLDQQTQLALIKSARRAKRVIARGEVTALLGRNKVKAAYSRSSDNIVVSLHFSQIEALLTTLGHEVPENVADFKPALYDALTALQQQMD